METGNDFGNEIGNLLRNEFKWSFRFQIMLITFISMALSLLGDLVIFLICMRTGFLTVREQSAVFSMQENSRLTAVFQASPSRDPGGVMLGEGNMFYRLFGVGIRWQLAVLLICCSIIIFFLVFFLLTRPMNRYIAQIVSGIGLMAQGDLRERLPVQKDDEFSYIAMQINKLADHVCSMEEATAEAEITKNDLITNVAHDLRTPLTSVMGYIDLARRAGGEEERDRYLDLALGKSKKLYHLVEELFDFTKASYGHAPLDLQRIDLASLLEQEIEEVYPVFEEHGLTCSFYCESRPVMVDADGEQLARVFDNLLSNAVRYGSDGKQVNVILRANVSNAQVQVINYGNIIPKESLPYLFEKFYKADKARRPSAEGTGLGLSIAKAIVENHGGSITADSGIDGTVFTVSLPLTAEDKSTAVYRVMESRQD